MNHPKVQEFKKKAKRLVKAKRAAGQTFFLKNAYDLIARHAGYANWRELKSALDDQGVFYPKSSAHLNVWFRTYEEAQNYIAKNGGYVFPFLHHFVCCNAEYLATLGIKSDDPDFRLVGHDFVNPKNSEAFKRLKQKLR